VVNTHYHFDHVFGNGEFVKMNATIISHTACKKRMEETGHGTLKGVGHYGLTEQDMKGTQLAYPTVSFKDTMVLDLGNLEVKLLHPGPSHTTGSVLVVVPGDNVLFAGDILFTDRHPFMGDADIDGWVKSLDYIITLEVEKIIPGHGPLSSKKDVADMKAYILLFDRTAKKLTASSDDFQYVVTQMKKVLPAKAGLESLIEANLQMKYMSK
jgi:glyoxylase-like metal-dependent hydrolase (beta-lactamase superfamily II)